MFENSQTPDDSRKIETATARLEFEMFYMP
jgi:hypothetical protein